MFMSWVDRKILNRDDALIVPSEEQKAIREVKEEIVDINEITTSKKNVVVIPASQFVCPKCNEGWTFSRMKTIVCCGITYVKD